MLFHDVISPVVSTVLQRFGILGGISIIRIEATRDPCWSASISYQPSGTSRIFLTSSIREKVLICAHLMEEES
jgi:hypothetical protein